MKFFILLLAIIAVARTHFTEEEEQKWIDFKLEHGKMFLSPGKELARKTTFLQNAKDIEEHNAAFENGDVTYTKQVHMYSDLTEEAFLARFSGTQLPADARASEPSDDVEMRATIPTSLNLTTKAGVGPIRDQKSCGSCWAFCTCASVEYAYWSKYGKIAELSEQQLVDCTYTYNGCNGGWPTSAMNYIASNKGIAWTSQYPYTATYGTCKGTTITPRAVNLNATTAWTQVASDDASLKAALNTYGVISIVVDANGWGSYSKGIFQAPNYTNPQINHGVALVGYGVDSKTNIPYWLIRNSWNTWWGQYGYIQLDARRDAQNHTYGGMFPQYAYLPKIL